MQILGLHGRLSASSNTSMGGNEKVALRNISAWTLQKPPLNARSLRPYAHRSYANTGSVGSGQSSVYPIYTRIDGGAFA